METSLTDIKKQYEKLKAIIGDEDSFDLSDEDALRCQDALKLMKERSYILDASSLSTISSKRQNGTASKTGWTR